MPGRRWEDPLPDRPRFAERTHLFCRRWLRRPRAGRLNPPRTSACWGDARQMLTRGAARPGGGRCGDPNTQANAQTQLVCTRWDDLCSMSPPQCGATCLLWQDRAKFLLFALDDVIFTLARLLWRLLITWDWRDSHTLHCITSQPIGQNETASAESYTQTIIRRAGAGADTSVTLYVKSVKHFVSGNNK